MTIWAFNKPAESAVAYVANSTRTGVSRFGWSWFNSANLNDLKEKPWEDMDEDEREVWSKSSFLLEISQDDWIVHINVPEWGRCIAARVAGVYRFDDDNEIRDFRHCIDIDKNSVIKFDRNDKNILPIVSRKLKLRGRYWRIYCEDEFHESIKNLKAGTVDLNGESRGVYFLKKDLSNPLEDITKLIHKNHDGKNLEGFLARVFRKIQNVENVIENGSGWGTDYGADLIVEYKSGLPVSGLEKIEKVVVQVKSYDGEHWETTAVEQIRVAIQKYEADAGMLITTAKKTDRVEKAIDNLSNEIDKPISLLAGVDVARFVMKFYGEELLSDV